MITHRSRSLRILVNDKWHSTEKLSTGLRNVRLLVRPQLVSAAPVFVAMGFGGGGGAPGRSQADFRPARGIYDAPRSRPSRVMWTMRLVRLELTFGTSGELLCLVAGPDINRT